jgi:hypothetical protein
MGGIEQNIDWTAATTPADDRVHPGLTTRAKTEAAPGARRDVMETLLGKNNLAAVDPSGGDPYNATGRHFRR